MIKIFAAILFSFVIGSTAYAGWENFPDQIYCSVDDPGVVLDVILVPSIIDTNGDFYGNAGDYIMAGVGYYVAYQPDGTYRQDYGIEDDCSVSIQDLPADKYRYFQVSGMPSEITVADDPTRNIFFGLVIFLTMFYGLIFYFRKQG